MKFSNGEKLILLMLGEIYQKLGIDGKASGEIDPKFIASAIYSGNEWGLGWKYSGIPFEHEEDPKIVGEVCNILDMWNFIEEGYAKLSEEDRKQVATDAEPFGTYVKFTGFDGNNECEYMSVAGFLIDDLERFSIFKGRDLNSHAPSIESYNRMYEVFDRIRPTLVMRSLSRDEIVELLKAKTHPSYK